MVSYDKAKLKDLKLEKNDYGVYFLNATYEYENKSGIYELNIPHIELPVHPNKLPDFDISLCFGGSETRVDLGFGMLQAVLDRKSDKTYTIKEIKKKTQKMTLSEIEAKLGHKIELISEK